MVQRPTIRHLKALVVDNISLGGQGCGSLKGLPRPFFLKSTLFTNSGRGKPQYDETNLNKSEKTRPATTLA